MQSIWDQDEPLPEEKFEYYQSNFGSRSATHFTKLMLLVKSPDIDDEIDRFRDFVLSCDREYLNRRNSEGSTALHICCLNSHDTNPKILNVLIEAGIDLDIQNNDGFTALLHSCSKPNILQILIKAGANVNLQDNRGRTALMTVSICAKYTGKDDIIRLLIDAGADPNIKGADGKTALNIVCGVVPRKEIIQTLMNVGSDPNSVEYTGYMDIEYFLDNGYSIYHPSLSNMTVEAYRKHIVPRIEQNCRRNTLIESELKNKINHIRFRPG